MFERMLLSGTAGGKGKGKKIGLFNRPLIASDGGVDWYGEVSAEELIDGESLASLVGLTAGTLINSDAGWLHVGLDGRELLIAKKTVRGNLSWDHLNSVNLVSGNTSVDIEGQHFIVRLIKSSLSDHITMSGDGYDHPSTHGSEWNRIFYRLTDEVYNYTKNKKTSEEPFTHLAHFTESELYLSEGYGVGAYTLCQETVNTNYVSRMAGYGVSYIYPFSKSHVHSRHGWRPVLERVV